MNSDQQLKVNVIIIVSHIVIQQIAIIVIDMCRYWC